MESSNLKNIVVLNDLPSNIVDEAIIVLKSSKKIKDLQKIERNKKKSNNQNIKKDKDYILKEAELLVNSYVSTIENKNNKKFNNYKLEEKYKKAKKYSIVATVLVILEALIILF